MAGRRAQFAEFSFWALGWMAMGTARPARGSDRGCRQTCSAGDCVSVLVAMLIVSPSLLGGDAFAPSLGLAWLDLSSFEHYVW